MAETTTISNLPQITLDELTNDTLVPVENVDGTKAANLGQLRKKLNSLYVEMADADLNELKQDGIYECLGTTLNAPTSDVGAWIVQTATHESVTVQNAFGLGEKTFSYIYRRRWDGVSWTAWENRILTNETRIAQKADASNTVTTNTNQTITATKTFTNTAQVVLLDSAARKLTLKSTAYDINAPEYGERYYGILNFKDKNDHIVGRCDVVTFSPTDEKARIVSINKEGYSSILEAGWENGIPLAKAPNPNITHTGNVVTTVKWVRDLLNISGQAYTWSNAQNGYIKFSNGFILQWGHGGANRGNSYGWDTITYPIAFTSFQVAQATMYNNDTTWQGDASQTAQGSIKRIGLTGMQCYYTNSNGFEWVAVGF